MGECVAVDTTDCCYFALGYVQYFLGRLCRVKGIHMDGSADYLKIFHNRGIHGSISRYFYDYDWLPKSITNIVVPSTRQQVTVVQLGQISGAKLEQTVITSHFQRWTTEVNQRQALPTDPRNSTVE